MKNDILMGATFGWFFCEPTGIATMKPLLRRTPVHFVRYSALRKSFTECCSL